MKNILIILISLLFLSSCLELNKIKNTDKMINNYRSIYDIVDTSKIPKSFVNTIQMLKDENVLLYKINAEQKMEEVVDPAEFTFKFSDFQKVTKQNEKKVELLIDAKFHDYYTIILSVFCPTHFLFQKDDYFAIFDPNNFMFIEISALGNFYDITVYLSNENYQNLIERMSTSIPNGLYLQSGINDDYTKRHINLIQQGNVEDEKIEIGISGFW